MNFTTYSPGYIFHLIRSKLPANRLILIIAYCFLICIGFYILPVLIGWYLTIFIFRKLSGGAAYILTGIVLLLTLFFGYAWGYSFIYAYQHPAPDTQTPAVTTVIRTPTPTATPTKTPTPTPTKVVTPVQTTSVPTPTPTQALSINITQSAGTVGRGYSATESITTEAGAYCTIEVDYESGPSKAQGLTPQTADGSGNVVWSWMVGTRTTLGSWPIYINCSLNGVSTQVTDQVNVTE